MQAGFTALESGLVRTKNSINVASKNFAVFCIAAIAAAILWIFRFALMFGGGGGFLGATEFLFGTDDPWLMAFFIFQVGFIGATGRAAASCSALCRRRAQGLSQVPQSRLVNTGDRAERLSGRGGPALRALSCWTPSSAPTEGPGLSPLELSRDNGRLQPPFGLAPCAPWSAQSRS